MLPLFVFDGEPPLNGKLFYELYSTYSQMVDNTVFKIIKNHDLCETVAISCWRAVDKHSKDISEMTEENKRKYIYAIVVNKCFDLYRTRRGSSSDFDPYEIDKIPEDYDFSEAIERMELLEKVHEAILGLAETERTVFLMKAKRGLTFRTISKLLGLQYHTVRRLYSAARKTVRKETEKYL